LSFGELRKNAALFAQIAGLALTGWMVWFSAIGPRSHRYTWATLAGSALGYCVYAWGWSVAITSGLYLAIPKEERPDFDGVMRTSLTAVWFAPAIMLLTQMSPAALAAALVLVISTTRLLYHEWVTLYPREEGPTGVAWRVLDDLVHPARPFLRQVGPALGAGLAVQMGATALAMRVPFLAAALMAVSASMLTVLAISSGAVTAGRPKNLPRSALGVVLTILLAAGMTIGGMSGRVVRHGVPGDVFEWFRKPSPVDSIIALLREIFYGEKLPPRIEEAKGDNQEAKKSPEPYTPKAPEPTPVPDGSYPGVILATETRPVTRLVAPVPASRGLGGEAPRPYSILFDGEYWMFSMLYRKPPSNSFHRKGTPTTMSFSTTDHWPLVMEAHQKLDEPIDLNCCVKIKVDIWNADRYPRTVGLELFAMQEGVAKSYGLLPVTSTPQVSGESVVAVPETLEFTIPTEEAVTACDELKVVFRRDHGRNDKSARVAIERFVLVPKGM